MKEHETEKKVEPADSSTIRLWRNNLADELNAAALYKALAQSEPDEERASIFQELAEVERDHAALWKNKLEGAGVHPGKGSLSFKTRLLALVARVLGTRSVFPIVQTIEATANNTYAGQTDSDARRLAGVEEGHAKVFAHLGRGGAGDIASVETWHRGTGGGSLRAAVFGVNDGLVSNFSLIMGVAGASLSPKSLLITGVAGMLAGAFSMGAGEYVSVRSQRELFEREIQKEEEELRSSPEEERKELELIYRAKGIPKEAAAELAAAMLSTPESALDTLAREELGLNPGDLGSPLGAATSSFFAFVAGALIPLLPFFFLKGTPGVAVSACLGGLALFAVGSSLSIFTGRNFFYSGLRMLLLGGAVALVTNFLGRLLGVTLG